MSKNKIKNEKAITLIALIVTIIVLLILAGVSIAVLTGDNSILRRSSEAKVTTKIAEIEEQANLLYTSKLITALKAPTGDRNVALATVCDELKKPENGGYNVDFKTTEAATVDKVIFTSENVTTESAGTVGTIKIGEGETAQTPREVQITATVVPTEASGGNWYAIVEGKYYKIDIPEGKKQIKIDRTESNVTGGGDLPAVTYAVTSPNPNNTGVTVNDSTGTIRVPNGATGPVTITASAGGKSATCTVTVLKYVTVTITAGEGGSLGSDSSTTGSYLEETPIPLVAKPSEGYKFVSWKKTINSETSQIGTSATTNYTVPGSDVTITAEFVPSAVNLGTEVTIGTQKFYVIKKFTEGNVDKVALLSKYNLATNANATTGKYEQTQGSYNSTKFRFSNTNYWSTQWNNNLENKRINLNNWETNYNSGNEYSGETTANNAILRARQYAIDVFGNNAGAKGRLLTYEEAKTGLDTCLFGGTGQPSTTVLYGRWTDTAEKVESDGCLYYWLASSGEFGNSVVWGANGDKSYLYTNYYGDSDDYGYGVRPVIEVPESAIQ